MSFRRKAQFLRPVRSIKHIVDTNGAVVGGTPSITNVVETVDDPGNTFPTQVAAGSTVHAIYLRVEVIQEIAAAGIDNIYLLVYKNPGGDLAPPNVDTVGSSDDRKRVVHQEMMMTGSVLTAANAIPRTLFKGVVLFPRAMKRNGIQDKWQVVIGHRNGETTQSTNFCLQCIYKEFR